eukprot:s828_g21.t1
MVFHIPGHVLQNAAELEGLMSDIALCALLGVRPVLVPSLAQRVLARLGHEVSTSSQELEALCGIAAASLDDVTRFMKQEAGMLCAEVQDVCLRVAAKPTGNFITRKSTSVFASSQLLSTAPRKATGWESSPLLGRVIEIDTAQIHRRLQEDDIVCILPVGAGSLLGTGSQLRYVPSEELAAQVAKELKATKLIFFTRGQRLLDTARGNVIPTMQLGEADRLLEYAKTSSSFVEKEESREVIFYLELLLQALRSGTRRAHLIDPRRGALLQELYTTDGSGTMISLDLYDGIRLARSGDVSGIFELIEPLVRRGLLRRRNTYEVERACNNQEMFVWKRDDKFVGCASLQQFSDAPGKAELGCFVISPLCRGKGHGAVLLSYIEQVARLLGVQQLFLLTTQTMQWFVERGFQNAPVEELPPGKREGYDLGRSSKVFIKNISDLPSELQQRFTFVEVRELGEISCADLSPVRLPKMSCQLSVIAVVLMMYFAGAIEGETGNPCFNRINWCSRWAVDGWCQRNPRLSRALLRHRQQPQLERRSRDRTTHDFQAAATMWSICGGGPERPGRKDVTQVCSGQCRRLLQCL